MESKKSTVDDLIATLTKLSESGKGNYVVWIGGEYTLRNDSPPSVDESDKSVDLEGFFG